MVADTSAGGFDDQRHGVAVQGSNDDLLDHFGHFAFFVNDLGEARGKGFHNAVSQEHAQKCTHQGRADQATEHRRGLVNGAHGLHHTQHAGHNAQRGQSTGQGGQGARVFEFVVVVQLDRSVHHVFHRIGAEVAGRHHHQAHGVANQVEQIVVVQDRRMFAKYGTGLGVFDVRLQRHRTLGFERFHDLGHQEHDGQIVFFFVLRALDDAAKTAKSTFENHTAVAGDHAANTSAANDEHFIRCGLDDGRQGSTGNDEAPEHTNHQHNQANDSNHLTLQTSGTTQGNLGNAPYQIAQGRD